MMRVITIVMLFLVACQAAPFTPGNFLITYVDGTTGTYSNIVTTKIKEFSVDGTGGQTIDISASCQSTLNRYSGAPRLSTDGQYVTIACYIPTAETNITLLKSTVAIVNSDGEIDVSTQFTMDENKIWYRALKDDSHIYIAGDNIVGHTSVGSNNSVVNLAPNVQLVQEVLIDEGNLYVTNFYENPWGMARVGDGLPLVSAPQSVTPIWATSLVDLTNGVTFFTRNEEKFAYVSAEGPTVLHVLKQDAQTGSWSKQYSSTLDTTYTVFVSQIYYENGDGTNTVLLASPSIIWKIIDDGTALNATFTPLISTQSITIKGIEWVPTPAPEPVAAPVEEPGAAPNAPTSVESPVSSNAPSNNAPQTAAPTGKVSTASSIVNEAMIIVPLSAMLVFVM